MDTSILTSVKKVLGLAEDYTAFDTDVIMHINTALGVLSQLGLGPTLGFTINDAVPVWANFIGSDLRLSMAKTYVYLRVKLIFDPPSSGFAITAIQDQIRELEWRISEQRESTGWVSPFPPTVTI